MYIIHIVNYMMIMCCVFLQYGETPLHVAASNGHLDVAKLILMKPEMIKQTDNVSEHCQTI